MKSRLKVYDVRKRVDKPEDGRKPCCLLICLYRRKSCLLLGAIDLTLWAKFWPQVRVVSLWALERIWLCFYPNISHCWVDFFKDDFCLKINKIRHKDMGEKSVHTWNQVPKTIPLSQQLRGSGTGLSGGKQWISPFHRWTRTWEWVQPVWGYFQVIPHPCFCPLNCCHKARREARAGHAERTDAEGPHGAHFSPAKQQCVPDKNSIWDVLAQRKHL